MKKTLLGMLIIMTVIFSACGNGENGNTIEATGNLEAENVSISAKVSGELLSLMVDEGDKIKKGDMIALVDTVKIALQLREAEAMVKLNQAKYDMMLNGARSEDIKQTERQVEQLQSLYEQAKTDKERMEKLYAEKTITKKQFDDVLTRYDVALSQYEAAKQQLKKVKHITRPEEFRQAEAALEQAIARMELLKSNLSDCYVKAPSDGIIVKTFVKEGEIIAPMATLCKISDQRTMELIVYVNSIDLAKVKLGQQVDVYIDAYKNKSYKGEIVYISPEAEFTPKNIQTKDERTKLVFGVKIEIDNPDFDLKYGMPADAVIHIN